MFMLAKKLSNIVGEKNLILDAPLKDICTYGIGGKAKYLVYPTNFQDCFDVVKLAELNDVKYKIVGNASNLLFVDDGFDGIIIGTKKINECIILPDNKILASAGTMLSKLLAVSIENELSGLEFLFGIPATVGGAILNNSGANGNEIKNVLLSVTYYENGEIKTESVDQLDLSYRHSKFTKKNAIIMFAEFKLKKGKKQDILQTISDFKNKRQNSQPTQKSAGCVFKKCGDYPAGLLIDKAGLKGTTVGGARISEVHANFFVNFGNASSNDILQLIEIAKKEIKEKYNKDLQLEIEVVK